MMLKETVEWCKPTRATKYSAGVDLYAKNDVVIDAGQTEIVNLGVKIDFKSFWEAYIEDNYSGYTEIQTERFKNSFLKSKFIELHPRSSLRAKGLIIGVGICDLDFPDELGLIVHNPIIEVASIFAINDFYWYGKGVGDTNTVPNEAMNKGGYIINKGDKIAQVLLKEHKGFLFGIESDAERNGGFGSSGN